MEQNLARIPRLTLYRRWLGEQRGLDFADYHAMWQWSVTDPAAFWQSIWDYFGLQSPTPHTSVLSGGPMPDFHWFDGAQCNYARQVFSHVAPADAARQPAILAENEAGEQRCIDWPELRRQVASLALHLKAQGVEPGDRIAAYLPNVPEAIVAFLAAASIGAVWSLCAPDMGSNAVLDRFRQIEPKVLIACDGVRYAGRDHDRSAAVAEMRAALPTVSHLLVCELLGKSLKIEGAASYAQAVARDDESTRVFEPVWLPFEHPLWIVYSSGTTGLPKPIVHGHGGIVLVTMVQVKLHSDLGPSYEADSFGERFHWYSSTGWIMWNLQVACLLAGTTACIFDGNPAGGGKEPDWTTLWRFAAAQKVTFFGAGAAYYANCMKGGLDISRCGDLSKLRALGSTGSPLAPEVQSWLTAQFAAIGTPVIWWSNVSGGTDFCGAFIGGNRELPLVPGELQVRQLGSAVEAWDEGGRPLIDAVGELVCTQPLPSMPLYFWGDAGNRRYLSSYFDMYPGVWRHGDWLRIRPNGGCIIYGRSDATINRHGLRMGTSELYSAVEALPEVLDSMVVDLEYLGRESYMPLFVVLRPGVQLDDALKGRIAGAIRTALSPRFIPNEIFQVDEIPRTLSGKKQELPIKKLLLGQPIDKVVNRDAMANPGCLEWYVAFAASRQST